MTFTCLSHTCSSLKDIDRFTTYLFFLTTFFSLLLSLSTHYDLLVFHLNWSTLHLPDSDSRNIPLIYLPWGILSNWKYLLGANSIYAQTLALIFARGSVLISFNSLFDYLSLKRVTSFNSTNHWISAFSLNHVFLFLTSQFFSWASHFSCGISLNVGNAN